MSAPVKILVRMADPVLITMEVILVVVERASLELTVKKVNSLIPKLSLPPSNCINNFDFKNQIQKV